MIMNYMLTYDNNYKMHTLPIGNVNNIIYPCKTEGLLIK